MDNTRKAVTAVFAIALIELSVGVTYGFVMNAQTPPKLETYGNYAPYGNSGQVATRHPTTTITDQTAATELTATLDPTATIPSWGLKEAK